jgi:hypothetical protein
MSKQIAKMAEHMKNETEVRRFKVSYLDLHIEVSIEFFTKKEDGSAVCRRKSIYIVRRDPCDVTEELGGDSFKISYLVYEDGVLLTEECSELDDGEGPIITYEDIMSCVDGFAAATDYEINHLKLPMPFVCRPQPK